MSANSKMSFDISSGNVEFGVLCPGTLMQNLQQNDLENVRKIKSLQMSYSTQHVTWQCPVGCSDLSVVKDFIESIESLEKLAVLNYEADISTLWLAIYHQTKSLKDLAIHGPPQKQLDVWTPSAINRIANELPELKKLEMDLSLEEAERCLSISVEKSSKKVPPVLNELAKLSRLESIVINVNLQDAACAFSNEHTWTVMGSTSFPPPNKKPCKELARKIFDLFHNYSPESSLKHLELRFPRRCWDDRCQFWTLAYSVNVRKTVVGVIVDAGRDWKSYLPGEPDYINGGMLRELVNEAYAERRRAFG